MADGSSGEYVELCSVSDFEARRWQEYADRWGTDQYDESPWLASAVVEYVALAYVVAFVPVRVWAVLVKIGLVG